VENRKFKPFGGVSSLTLGGGGLGQIWGETTREEAVATVSLAIENGITHIDVAPMYGKGEAEIVVGEALKGKSIDGIHVTTKCRLGTLPDDQVYDYLSKSLTRSLDSMNLQRVDLFLLHSQLIEDGFILHTNDEFKHRTSTTLSSFFNTVIPSFEKLKEEGRIGSWGIGGLGQNKALKKAINHEIKPEAIQCVVNPLNSAGAIGYVDREYNPKEILLESQKNNIPILAIRAVQAGALTEKMDRDPHPSGMDKLDFDDYERAAPFRALAKRWNESAASLAYRYALSIKNISSIILGVKNRDELKDCIKYEQKDRLTKDQIEEIDKVMSS
tara:strand:- start:995 stop:1978 length:984 start_codon:yes stop_codon:yes gene_type:complete